MPTFKHVTLNIHTPKDPPASTENFSWANTAHSSLSEYGVHRLRNTPKITSYIPSSTNSPFAISITILDTYVPKNEGDDRESLAAYVYFDGREKEETATLLRRGVETWISSRWVEVKEGELAEREFVFKEVGLENFLSGLDLSKSEKQANEKLNGRKAVNRRHSMPIKMIPEGDDDDAEGKESAGQIRVDLFRVRCEGPVRRGVWGGMFKDNNNRPDNDDFGGGVDVSHTAGYVNCLTPGSAGRIERDGLVGKRNGFPAVSINSYRELIHVFSLRTGYRNQSHLTERLFLRKVSVT